MHHQLAALLRRGALVAAAVPALALAAHAQQATLDEGTLVVTVRGAAAGRESFRIQSAADAGRVYMATGQIAHGERRISPSLSADASGNALLYRVEVRSGSQLGERLQASARPGRLSAVRHTPQGEASKEYVVGQGAVVLDEDVYHQHALLALGKRSGAVTVVVPRAGAQVSATLTERGADPVTIDGQQVPATHWSLAMPGGAHDFWTDDKGRLLKVEVASRGVVAVRDERPR